MSRNIEVPSVAPGEKLIAQGGASSIIVNGDVGEGAELIAQGGSAKIVVKGHVGAHAHLTAQGGSSMVKVASKHVTAKCVAQGGGSKVIIGKVTDVPEADDWREKMRKKEQIFREGPRPPKPPRMPQFPRYPGMFSTTYVDDFKVTGSVGSVVIKNGEIWVDGEKVNKGTVKAADVPPTEPEGTITVQKSQRPRELWGT